MTDPLPQPPAQHPLSLRERFDRHVIPEPNSGCFLWEGATSGHMGYGNFRVGPGHWEVAHRVAWRLTRGPIPTGFKVLHKCDTPCCVNPDHLFLGTNAVNQADMARKARGVRSPCGLPFGVKRQSRGGGFLARITVASETRYLGTYRTIAEAAAVALAAKREVGR